MDFNNIILPFKSTYTDCIIYCHNLDKDDVDYINNAISSRWIDLLTYFQKKIYDKNGFLNTLDDKNIIKYILYSESLSIDFDYMVSIFLNDEYKFITDDGGTSNMIMLLFDDNIVTCELKTISNF